MRCMDDELSCSDLYDIEIEEAEEEEVDAFSDAGIIQYLESHAFIADYVKNRCIEAIKAQKHSKVEAYNGNHYCECGCPVEYFIIPYSDEIGKQPYCSECGALLDWDGVEIVLN